MMSYKTGILAIVICLLFSCNNTKQDANKSDDEKVANTEKVDTVSTQVKDKVDEESTVDTIEQVNTNTQEESDSKMMQIDSRLKEVKSALENHQWAKFISYSDPVLHAEQKDLGMSHQQYIFEMLNFPSLQEKDYQQHISETMSQIKTVTFDTSEIDTSFDYISVPGLVTLRNGETMPISLQLMLIDPPLITGANG